MGRCGASSGHWRGCSRRRSSRQAAGEAWLAASSHAIAADGRITHQPQAIRDRLAQADAFVHAQDLPESDLLLAGDYAAHEAGFEVHGWTFRPTTLEAAFLLTQPYIDMGLDGFFTDFPDLTRQVIQANQIVPIPLPASGLVLIGGLGALIALRRRRR